MILPDIAAALALVVERLDGVDVAAAVNPEEVNIPGVWVDFSGRLEWTLGGCRVGVEVVLLVPANDRATALNDLQALLDPVLTELGAPDGDARKQATVLPDGPVAYPSLVLPYIVEA